MSGRVRRLRLAGWVAGLGVAAGTGCQGVPAGQPLFPSKQVDPETAIGGGPRTPHHRPAPKAPEVDDALLPKELNKVTMPPYTVEAPDILLIDASRLVPLPPYKIQPLDSLFVNLPPGLEGVDVNGIYPVDPDGTINLGPTLGGAFRVADLSTQEVQQQLVQRLIRVLKLKDDTIVRQLSVSLAASAGVQRVQGEHLVRPDGTVSLGNYGSVYVAGLSLPQVKAAVEAQLSRYLYKPEVSVDVYAYNSKFYYVITDFAGAGESVVKLPSTGNETVLDAVANIGGLSSVSSKRIWIARPGPNGVGDQILPVDWRGITRRGTTRTNFQVLPGDRVFIMGDQLSKLDTVLARTLAPAERALGATLLGTSTVQQLRFFNRGFGLVGSGLGTGVVGGGF